MVLALVFVLVVVSTISAGRPQREVVAEELHDESGVLVVTLLELVELGNGIVERALGQGAGFFLLLQDLVQTH